LIAVAARSGDLWKVVSASVYAAVLLALYITSSLYHSLHGAAAKSAFRKMDHCAIYLLIAGSYTPFAFVTLRENSLSPCNKNFCKGTASHLCCCLLLHQA
jgi:hemolysin III